MKHNCISALRFSQSALPALALTVSLFIFSTPAFAISLADAKAQGAVGEKQSGYTGAVQGAGSPDVQAIVNDVNQKRKDKYFEIAKKNGTELAAVEALAGKKAVEATSAGQYVESAPGQWSKK